jgi:apolipoprotein N-acyltransferase
MAIGAKPSTVFAQVFKDQLIPLMSGLSVAAISVIGVWWLLRASGVYFNLSIAGWILPFALILLIAALPAFLCTRVIVQQRVSALLRGD